MKQKEGMTRLFNIGVRLKSVLKGVTITSLLCSIFISHIVIQNLCVGDENEMEMNFYELVMKMMNKLIKFSEILGL
jgi:low affinity Fe/Cu permease